MSVHPSTFPSISPTKLPSDIRSEKPIDKPSIHPLQDPTGFPSLFLSIQDSDFSAHVPSVYSSSKPSDGPSRIPIYNTSLRPSVSLSQTIHGTHIVHFSPIPSSNASTPQCTRKYWMLNTVINIQSYQVLCLVLLQVFFQVNSLIYHHQVYLLRCQQLLPTQHPSGIQYNHHLTKLLVYHFLFNQVQIPAGNHHTALVQ